MIDEDEDNTAYLSELEEMTEDDMVNDPSWLPQLGDSNDESTTQHLKKEDLEERW